MTNTPLFANNAASVLVYGIAATATSAQLSPGTGSLFPQPSGTEFFALTFVDVLTQTVREIVYVTAMSGDTIVTMARGQEGTSALTWPAGSLCQALITAGSLGLLGDGGGASDVPLVALPAPVSNVITLPFAQEGDIAYSGAITENVTIAISGGSTSEYQKIYVYVAENSAGGFTIGLPGSPTVLWPNGSTPIPNTAPNAINGFVFSTTPAPDVYQGLSAGGSSFTGGTLMQPLILAGDPVVPLGAATKEYVDEGVASAVFNGGTVANPIILPGAPTTANMAADKAYVDASVFTGGTLTQPLILSGNPTQALGAATKAYVDGSVKQSPFVLDNLVVYPAVAFSIRQLTQSANLPAFCMTVRRSSDNTTANIGFLNGVLNTTALLAFVGSGNGFVVTWKNQGSLGAAADAAQPTAASQPQIVNAGAVITQNGLPVLTFNSSFFISSGFGVFAQNTTVNCVLEQNASEAFGALFINGQDASSTGAGGIYLSGSAFAVGCSGIGTSPFPKGNVANGLPVVFTGTSIAALSSTVLTVTGYQNGALIDTMTQNQFGATQLNSTYIGWDNKSGTDFISANIQEIVLNSAIISTADRQELEASQISAFIPTISIIEPANNIIFPRLTTKSGVNGAGTGTINLIAAVGVPIALVEYRLRDAINTGNPVLQNWTTCAVNLQPGAQIINCVGVAALLGWYFVDRRINGVTITLGTSKVGVGRLILVAGQSEATGFFSPLAGSTETLASLGITPNPNGSANYESGGIYRPTWAIPADGTLVNSPGVTVFLANQIAAANCNCGAVGATANGTVISSWLPGEPNGIALANMLVAGGGIYEAVYWYQGASDADISTSNAVYQACLTMVFDLMQSLNAFVGFIKCMSHIQSINTTSFGVFSQMLVIRQAQQQWCAGNNAIWIPQTDPGLINSGANNNIEIAPDGYILVGHSLHRALEPSLGLGGVGNAGPVMTSITRAGAVITVNCTQAGGTAFTTVGNWWQRFAAFNTGTLITPLTISSGTIVSATQFTLTLATAPAGEIDLYFDYIPSGQTANASLMIYDNNTSIDGFAQGRPLFPGYAPLTA
jgi:hypothetical protein